MPGPATPRAVILAAGTGTRLTPRTAALPKPLVPLGGKPLIAYTLAALARTGVTDVTVVTGYRENLVRTALGDGSAYGVSITCVSNPGFARGASFSLRAAREAVGGDPFLLLMADHLLGADLIATLVEGQGEVPGVAADFLRTRPRSHAFIAEATKLATDERLNVTAIGKQVEPWTALDAGAFACTPEVWEAVDAAPLDCDLSTIFGGLARRRRLRAIDVSGCFWYDVDTDADLRAAGELLAASSDERVNLRRAL